MHLSGWHTSETTLELVLLFGAQRKSFHPQEDEKARIWWRFREWGRGESIILQEGDILKTLEHPFLGTCKDQAAYHGPLGFTSLGCSSLSHHCCCHHTGLLRNKAPFSSLSGVDEGWKVQCKCILRDETGDVSKGVCNTETDGLRWYRMLSSPRPVTSISESWNSLMESHRIRTISQVPCLGFFIPTLCLSTCGM